MKRTLTFTSAVVVAALSLPVLPAVAQQHRGGGNSGGGGRVASAPRQQSAPRQAPPARSAPGGGRTYSPQAPPRTSAPRTYAPPQALPGSSGARTYAAPQSVPRNDGSGAYRNGAQAVPRTGGGERYGMNRGYSTPGFRGGSRPTMVRPYFSHAYARPYGWRPYNPYRFVRPYYVFSPWLDLGFGIWCGFPVPYPWVYLGDYQPTVFGYDSDAYQVVPGATTYGGVSFDMQPADANLFVDGQFVGVVGSFGPANEPLTLEPGTHRVAIQREGYRPLEWDVTIEPGQVIPYRGALERQ
jgi:hypothetical protein